MKTSSPQRIGQLQWGNKAAELGARFFQFFAPFDLLRPFDLLPIQPSTERLSLQRTRVTLILVASQIRLANTQRSQKNLAERERPKLVLSHAQLKR